MSVRFEPGATSHSSFSDDLWYDNCRLSTKFPQLYQICSNKLITVVEVVHSQWSRMKFRSLEGY